MDATVAPDTLRAGPPLSRRPGITLPAEDEPVMPDASEQQQHLPPPKPARRGRRGGLLATAAAVGVLAGGIAFALSPYNTIYPISLSEVGATARRAVESTGLIAPAARMAQAPTPMPAAAPVRPSLPPASPEAQREELMGFHPRAPRDAGAERRAGGPGALPGGAAAATPPRGLQVPAAGPRAEAAPAPQGEAETAAPHRVALPPAPPAAPAQAPAARGPSAMSPAAPLPAPAAAAPPLGLAGPNGAASASPALAAPPGAPQIAPPPALSLTPPGDALAGAAPSGEQPRVEVPAGPAPAPGPTPNAALAAAAPPPLTVVPPAPPRQTAPVDASGIAANLRAAPMAGPQQVEVLGLVTQMGVMMRDQREENRQLRQDVAAMREALDGQLADFSRRLSLAEARGAINAAMGAAAPAPRPEGTAAADRPPVRSAQGGSRPEERRRYRVQAASPGLAMLAEVDRSGEAGATLQISIGDEIPGYGRVHSIGQEGSTWIVRAERGAIQ